jgi:hypothetical protein
MAVTVTQLAPFEWEIDRRITTTYRVFADGGESDADIATAAESDIPTTLEGLGNRTITLRLLVAKSGAAQWRAAVRWTASGVGGQKPVSRETGDNVYQFEVGAESVLVTQSLETISKHPAGTAADYKGALNVSRDGANLRVQGVNIDDPFFRWSETHYLSTATVTAAYRKGLADLRATPLNAAAFAVASGAATTYPIGTVKFLGASGTQRADDWEITFHFAYRKDEVIPVTYYTGASENVTKPGWAYIWFSYDDLVDANELVKQPRAAYVERMFAVGDFTALGIR